tara:strand:- start:51 stop:752 length:702 start_codon:yes stop_codon:yes gene_type:complete
MKVVILAGGYGTRLAELTYSIPKPMVPIGGIPILMHIINYYRKFEFNDFIIAGGYKIEIINDYFDKKKKNYKIQIIDTGQDTMTGGRLRKIKTYLKEENFFMTYGDGLSNVNINELLKFHLKENKLVTVTAVRPPARFGSLIINENNIVTRFREKSQLDEGWINGGFFVMKRKFIDFIDDNTTILEKKPLELMSKKNELLAYKHYGFWQCMDHLTDKKYLESLFESKTAPWLQ